MLVVKFWGSKKLYVDFLQGTGVSYPQLPWCSWVSGISFPQHSHPSFLSGLLAAGSYIYKKIYRDAKANPKILSWASRKREWKYLSKMTCKDELLYYREEGDSAAASTGHPTCPRLGDSHLSCPSLYVGDSGPRFSTLAPHCFLILTSGPQFQGIWFNWSGIGPGGFNMQPESRATGCNQSWHVTAIYHVMLHTCRQPESSESPRTVYTRCY